MRAAIAVTCTLTVDPSFMLLHRLSTLKLEESILYGGSIIFPPSMKRINLSSSYRSFIFECYAPFPKLTRPRAKPAARE